MPPGPEFLGIDVQRQVAGAVEADFVGAEAVFAQEVVGLVEAMLARQQFGVAGGAGFAGQRGIPQPALVGAEIDATQAEAAVEPAHVAHDLLVRLVGRADDELGAGLDPLVAGALRRQRGDALEGRDDGLEIILPRGELGEVFFAGGFDVEGDARGQREGALDGGVRRAGNDLEVQDAAEALAPAQDFGGGEHAFHGGVGRAAHPAGQEQPHHLPGTPIRQEGAHDFLGPERAARRGIVPRAQRAVLAVVGAGVGHQRLEHQAATAVLQRDGIEPAVVQPPAARIARGAGAGARQIVLGVGREDSQLRLQIRRGADGDHAGTLSEPAFRFKRGAQCVQRPFKPIEAATLKRGLQTRPVCSPAFRLDSPTGAFPSVFRMRRLGPSRPTFANLDRGNRSNRAGKYRLPIFPPD